MIEWLVDLALRKRLVVMMVCLFAAAYGYYSWRQLAGAGALAGIGFTMSLFIAGEAFPAAADFAAAKIAIFIASLAAGILGTAILWKRRAESDDAGYGNEVAATKI